MFKNLLTLAVAATLALPAALHAADEMPALDAPPPPAKLSDSEKSQTLQALGWLMGAQSQLDQLGMSDSEIEDFLKGFRPFLQGKESPVKDMQKATEKLGAFLQARTIETRLKWDQKNRDYLSEIDKQDGVQKTASGLRYKIIEKGTSPIPNLKSSVVAKYKGSLIDGRVFDSTEKQGGTPAEFPLTTPDGKPAVIEGWREGLQKIGKGGKIMLYIPQDLGYGTQGNQNGGILPMSALIFEVEIVDVKDAPAADTAAPITPVTK